MTVGPTGLVAVAMAISEGVMLGVAESGAGVGVENVPSWVGPADADGTKGIALGVA